MTTKDPLTVAIEAISTAYNTASHIKIYLAENEPGNAARGVPDLLEQLQNALFALTAPRAAADTEREAFEQTELAQKYGIARYSGSGNSPEIEYESEITNDLWRGWKLRAALSQPAKEQEPAYCPNCRGTGETTVMSDNGPDAHEVPIVCPHCDGAQTLEAAYSGVCKLLDAEHKKYMKACGEIWRMSSPSLVDWKDMFEKRTRERDALRARLDKYEKDDVVYPVAAPPQAEAHIDPVTAMLRDEFVSQAEAQSKEGGAE